jgi:hypothetical protein
MTLFNTLLLREWIQYRWGWLCVVAIPLILLLALVPFSQVAGVETMAPEPIALISAGLTLGLIMAVAFATSVYQLVNLPRRDQQDRSIEFWKSLPGTDTQSVAAPMLAHALLMPLAVLVLASVGSAVVGVAMAYKELGADGLRQMQWAGLGPAALWAVARLALGVALAMLWLSPMLLAMMAAGAWFKRWGPPLLVFVVGALLKLYEPLGLQQVLGRQLQGAASAFFASAAGLPDMPDESKTLPIEVVYDTLYRVPTWAPHDMLLALRSTWHPQFIGGLLLAAVCFGLIVLQRRRAG